MILLKLIANKAWEFIRFHDPDARGNASNDCYHVVLQMHREVHCTNEGWDLQRAVNRLRSIEKMKNNKPRSWTLKGEPRTGENPTKWDN